jgi:ribosomal protein S3AE
MVTLTTVDQCDFEIIKLTVTLGQVSKHSKKMIRHKIDELLDRRLELMDGVERAPLDQTLDEFIESAIKNAKVGC